MTRRHVTSNVSAALVNYVLTRSGLTQEQLAERLEVSPAFISRVRSRERSLTVDHLDAIEELTKLPLGAMLLAIMPPVKAGDAKAERLRALAKLAIEQADKSVAALRKRQKPANVAS